MGRLRNWLDRNTQEREIELEIIYDQVATVDVYRVNETGSNPGVTDEIDDATYLKTINIRLDRPAYRSDSFDYIAMTDDTDVRLYDRWRWTSTLGSSYYLIVTKTTPRPTGAEVEVKYA